MKIILYIKKKINKKKLTKNQNWRKKKTKKIKK